MRLAATQDPMPPEYSTTDLRSMTTPLDDPDPIGTHIASLADEFSARGFDPRTYRSSRLTQDQIADGARLAAAIKRMQTGRP